MNNSDANQDEIINFPVPKRYLPVVVQALAKAMETSGATAAPPEAISTPLVQGAIAPKIDWTLVANARKLRQALHIPIANALLDLTAERAGELVPFSDVVAKAGLASSQQARSSLGALTKVIKREFCVPYEGANWPVVIQYGEGGVAIYLMSHENAEAWRLSATQ